MLHKSKNEAGRCQDRGNSWSAPRLSPGTSTTTIVTIGVRTLQFADDRAVFVGAMSEVERKAALVIDNNDFWEPIQENEHTEERRL